MNAPNLRDKTVLVMGLGRFGGGVDVARFAAGAGARVVVTDMATEEKLTEALDQLRSVPGITFKLGGHDSHDFMTADVIVVNPAVPPDHELLQMARRQDKTVTSQIALFFQLCRARVVGITGANGKSTTTALTAHLLERARSGRADPGYGAVWIGGNIGHRPLLASLDRIEPEDIVVLELSSFQLEQLAEIRQAPAVALITNLTPNHLDRHGTFEAYCQAKENIFRLQTLDTETPAISIFNASDPLAMEWFDKYRRQPRRICLTYSDHDVPELVRRRFALPGRANRSNLAGAMAIVRQFGLDDETIARVLPSFKPLPHRLELVADINGVRWYNDSIATTPESAMVALDALEEPKIIIAGGYDKGLPFDALGQKIATGAKGAILIGQTAPKIAAAIATGAAHAPTPEIAHAQSLAEAVQLANQWAVPGDVVLLSPACASYDMFENFQHRGRAFCELVSRLERTL